jgi:hypothetical protein
LTSAPDATNTPPVVRLIEPGFSWTGHSASPSHVLDQGTKYIIRWDAQDTDAIVSQRILFPPDGHYPDRFVVVADGLSPDQRSYEWVVPNPGYATTNQPQFIRVVAVDAAGQGRTRRMGPNAARRAFGPDPGRTHNYDQSPPVVTDAVSITLAEYTAAQKRLRVRATSTSGTATLKVYVTTDSTLIGTLSNLGKGIYEGLFLWPVDPRNITVISSNGGSATR